MRSSCVRTYFMEKRADSFEFDTTNSQFIVRVAHGHNTIKTPPFLTAHQGKEIKYKMIIKTLHLLQIGDLADPIYLQGRKGMYIYHFIKCNIIKA